jgi:transcription initiation factor IIE alpha subunit
MLLSPQRKLIEIIHLIEIHHLIRRLRNATIVTFKADRDQSSDQKTLPSSHLKLIEINHLIRRLRNATIAASKADRD